MENSGSDFSCIAIISRCVDTGLKLTEDAIYQVYKKAFLKILILANLSLFPTSETFLSAFFTWLSRRNGRPRPKYSTYYSWQWTRHQALPIHLIWNLRENFMYTKCYPKGENYILFWLVCFFVSNLPRDVLKRIYLFVLLLILHK